MPRAMHCTCCGCIRVLSSDRTTGFVLEVPWREVGFFRSVGRQGLPFVCDAVSSSPHFVPEGRHCSFPDLLQLLCILAPDNFMQSELHRLGALPLTSRPPFTVIVQACICGRTQILRAIGVRTGVRRSSFLPMGHAQGRGHPVHGMNLLPVTKCCRRNQFCS